MKKTILIFTISLCCGFQILFSGSAWSEKQYTIAFSQTTTTEPWRLQFNKELRAEAAMHPEIKLIVRDGMDTIKKQKADINDFIKMKVDVILISPKVAKELTPVVNKAFDMGIPVIVLDRDLDNNRYTQFIGGDNKLIGRTAGHYAVKLLGGAGKAKGNIVEIWGGMSSTPAKDRHNGFYEVIKKEQGIKLLLKPTDGDWKQDNGYEIMANALDEHTQIDLVYAHNDPMAYGAYLAAKDVEREAKTAFLGIDGIPAEGVKWVYDGILTATFLYKTPGDEGIRQAIQLLNGQPIKSRITLPTMTIDKLNAKQILHKNNMLKK
ncbi:MAG: sugar ABC transporter substrate-binding protein [Desulfobacteraceae bacterium 4572_19]|nr:MAG: sugar ABC transporter substrate-binding protein [Desulfobacteraceae bacterium 4572_19]